MNGKTPRKTDQAAREEFSVHPKSFVFFDKRTGTRRFEVKADPHGTLPVDQALSLLVAHCLMRKQKPNDFRVLIAANENFLEPLKHRATKLIQACPAIQAHSRLTGRQQEVLSRVLQNLSNKEIGSRLNLSVRTVKFHVSALLSKFEVGGRRDLIQKAADLLSVMKVPAGLNVPRLVVDKEQGVGQGLMNTRERVLHVNALERRSHA